MVSQNEPQLCFLLLGVTPMSPHTRRFKKYLKNLLKIRVYLVRGVISRLGSLINAEIPKFILKMSLIRKAVYNQTAKRELV